MGEENKRIKTSRRKLGINAKKYKNKSNERDRLERIMTKNKHMER